MPFPPWLLRKLYARGSLRDHGDGTFSFIIQNPLGSATLVAPPRFVINGVPHGPGSILVEGIDMAAIAPDSPHLFAKGDAHRMTFRGHLLRGGNRIQGRFQTTEYGELELFVEARAATGAATDAEAE